RSCLGQGRGLLTLAVRQEAHRALGLLLIHPVESLEHGDRLADIARSGETFDLKIGLRKEGRLAKAPGPIEGWALSHPFKDGESILRLVPELSPVAPLSGDRSSS